MRMYNMNYTAAYDISRHLIYKMFVSGAKMVSENERCGREGALASREFEYAP